MKELTAYERSILTSLRDYCEMIVEEVEVRLQEPWTLSVDGDDEDADAVARWAEWLERAKERLADYDLRVRGIIERERGKGNEKLKG